MEPTHKLIIAMLVAYIPFIWYWVGLWIADSKRFAAEKRRKPRYEREPIEWWEQ